MCDQEIIDKPRICRRNAAPQDPQCTGRRAPGNGPTSRTVTIVTASTFRMLLSVEVQRDSAKRMEHLQD
jgi:hypothetical protein